VQVIIAVCILLVSILVNMKVYTACSEHGLILLFRFVCAGTLDEYWYPEQIIASTLQ